MSAQHSDAGRRLLALLNTEPGEARLAGLLTLLHLSLITAVVFVQTIAFGLFVTQFGAQNLPLAYITTAVLAPLVALASLKLSARSAYARSLRLAIALCAGVCALFWIGLNTSLAAAFIFLLPAWFHILIYLANRIVWPLAGRLFDPQQGKRLFGIIGAGGWVAYIAGGILVVPLVARFGAANMLLAAIAAMGSSALVMRAITRGYLQPAQAPIPQLAQPQTRPAPLTRNRYVALIIAQVCVWWVAFFFVDNIFYNRASLQFPNAIELTAFIGMSLSFIGAIALVVTVLSNSRILQRYGLRAGLLLMPALVTALIALTALFGALDAAIVVSFFFATLAKVANVSLGFTISQSAGNVAYQALPGEQRARARTVAEGIVQPIAVGIAGALLLALNVELHLGVMRIAFVFLVLAAGWIGIIILLAREYPQALTRVLRKRQFHEPDTFIADATAVDVLANALKDPRPGVALHAMHMLAQMSPARLTQAIAQMLDHPSDEVREAALQTIETMEARPAADAVRQRLLVEASPQVKSAALRTLAAIDDEMDESLAITLRDDDVRVAKGALVGLLLHGEVKGVLAAQARLAEWAQSSDALKRSMAARAIGEAGATSERAALARLLGDADVDVRRAALWAAGCVKDVALWPQVIAACDAPETMQAAVQALARGDVNAVALIRSELQTKQKPQRSRRALVQALCRSEADAAVPALRAMTKDAGAGVRRRALASLMARHSAIDLNDARAGIYEEVARMAWACAATVDLTPFPEGRAGDGMLAQQRSSSLSLVLQPLIAALQAECDAVRERILLWLACSGQRDGMLQAREALASLDVAQRAAALEMIDAQLPAELKGWVMPALEPLSPAERLVHWRSAFPQTRQPIAARLRQAAVGAPAVWLTTWTKACALDAIARLPVWECADVMATMRESPEPLLRMMAQWAGAQGGNTMLSIVERVMILRGASLFAQTPDDALAEVAALLQETDASAGVLLFTKGEPGDCLYIIVSGKVRIHDGARVLNELGEGDTFGEMALLDPEPRLASASVTEQARLLRLDHAPLFDLIAARPEVSIGIIHMLTRRLRERVQDLSRLDAQIKALAGATTAAS